MKFHKHVKMLSCIFCARAFPLDTTDFRAMNKHGWGCCADCWELDLPNARADTHTYLPPEVLAAMHISKNCEP